jgi:hypothetical protein
MAKVEPTFGDLCDAVSGVAKAAGFFLDRDAPKVDGMQHVGWWCRKCEQRLMSCNSDGHRAGPAADWRLTDCPVPGEELLPMYVPKEVT